MAARAWMTIGSRASPLALAQTEEARRAIAAANGVAVEDIVIEQIRTTGDKIVDRSLAEAGGKGLFTKELDLALLEGRIDCAVHSAKDLPTFLPEGLDIAGYRPREDARDAFVSAIAGAVADLPAGATFGSASPRRLAQVLRQRPDLKPVLLRGNVETRLRKAESREVGATILAIAGLRRLGLAHRATRVLSPTEFLPAAGQGAVAVTVRAQDRATRAALAPALDADTGYALSAERAFLAALDGSCRTPIACHATKNGDRLALRGAVFDVDGARCWDVADEAGVAEAEALGARAGASLRARLPEDFFDGRP